MIFREGTPSDRSVLTEWVSEAGKVTVAVLAYAFGQMRIQVWLLPNPRQRIPDILVEM